MPLLDGGFRPEGGGMGKFRGVFVCGLATLAIISAIAMLPVALASGSLPSGEMRVGQSLVEPAYNDVNGNIVYLLTPMHAPDPVKSNSNSWAPFYVVVYPAGSTVGTLNCMGVPGNCPDHDGAIAGAATFFMSSVYGTGVIGHDHLMAPPASGGDFNIAWHVFLVLFTPSGNVNEHLTTLAEIQAALTAGHVAKIDSGIVFTCAVVPAVVYNSGTPFTG